ncbi:MAG: beta-N-acetylhexosaminidase, partial [Sphingomonadales bacterium]
MPLTGRRIALLFAAAMLPASLSAATYGAPAMVSVQADYDALARDMGVRFQVIDNHPEKCPAGADGCFFSTLTFTMPARLPAGLGSDEFAIYFSFVNRLPVVESDVFQHNLINGDLQRLTFKPGAALAPGKTYDVKLFGIGAQHSVAYAMPNIYLTAKGVTARVIEATRPRIDRETGLETLPYVVPMSDEAKLASRGAADKTVWQTPERAYEAFAERGAAATPEIAILPTPQLAEIRPGKLRG